MLVVFAPSESLVAYALIVVLTVREDDGTDWQTSDPLFCTTDVANVINQISARSAELLLLAEGGTRDLSLLFVCSNPIQIYGHCCTDVWLFQVPCTCTRDNTDLFLKDMVWCRLPGCSGFLLLSYTTSECCYLIITTTAADSLCSAVEWSQPLLVVVCCVIVSVFSLRCTFHCAKSLVISPWLN